MPDLDPLAYLQLAGLALTGLFQISGYLHSLLAML